MQVLKRCGIKQLFSPPVEPNLAAQERGHMMELLANALRFLHLQLIVAHKKIRESICLYNSCVTMISPMLDLNYDTQFFVALSEQLHIRIRKHKFY
jgi:hypothetical protein